MPQFRSQKEIFQKALKDRVGRIGTDLELLRQEVAKFKEDTVDVAEQAEYGSMAKSLQGRIAAVEEELQSANEEQGLYHWKPAEFPGIQEISASLEPYAMLWIITADFNQNVEDWLHGPFKRLDPEALEETVGDWYKRMYRLTKTFASKDPHLQEIAEATRRGLETFKINLPVIASICNPGMRARHWSLVSRMVGFEVQPDEQTSLNKLLESGILSHEHQLQVFLLLCLNPNVLHAPLAASYLCPARQACCRFRGTKLTNTCQVLSKTNYSLVRI